MSSDSKKKFTEVHCSNGIFYMEDRFVCRSQFFREQKELPEFKFYSSTLTKEELDKGLELYKQYLSKKVIIDDSMIRYFCFDGYDNSYEKFINIFSKELWREITPGDNSVVFNCFEEHKMIENLRNALIHPDKLMEYIDCFFENIKIRLKRVEIRFTTSDSKLVKGRYVQHTIKLNDINTYPNVTILLRAKLPKKYHTGFSLKRLSINFISY